MSSDRIQLILSIVAIVGGVCGGLAKVLPAGKWQEFFAFMGLLAKPKPVGLQPEAGDAPKPKGDA